MSSFDTLLKMINTPLGKLLQDTHDALEVLHSRTVGLKKEIVAVDARVTKHVEGGFEAFSASYGHSLNALINRVTKLENKPDEYQTHLKAHKEILDGTKGLSTRGGKRGKKVAAKRKKKGPRAGGNGRGKKLDDSGDSAKPVRKKRGRPPFNRLSPK